MTSVTDKTSQHKGQRKFPALMPQIGNASSCLSYREMHIHKKVRRLSVLLLYHTLKGIL